ncbi:GntR family transcriptional regulator [Candidatus Bipolaricaulota bacterium]
MKRHKNGWALDMSAGPIFEQIGKNARRLLARGDLHPGEKLPSARDLAGTLSVNPNTIVHAYAQLETQGIIEKRRGLGTFVREDAPVATMRREMLQQIAETFVSEVRRLGVGDEEAMAALKEAWDAG